MTTWDNKVFTSSRIMDRKDFILLEGMYNSGDSDSGIKVVVVDVYAMCSNREN